MLFFHRSWLKIAMYCVVRTYLYIRCFVFPPVLTQDYAILWIWTNKQICHDSVGILMECLPEGGWFFRGETFHQDTHAGMAYLFYYPNKPQFGKILMKTTMTACTSSENGGRFAGGHFAGGHDGMANLCKPITAYDFHVRYNNIEMSYCSFQQSRYKVINKDQWCNVLEFSRTIAPDLSNYDEDGACE